MAEDNQQLERILEGAIFAAGEPLSVNALQNLFDVDAMPEKPAILAALEAIKARYSDRGIYLLEVASGWRFQVRENLAPWVNRLWEERPQKYSRALLETLALIAYRQPLTRGDIEEVRGVSVSSHIIKTLSERDWIKVVGHRDIPGRPSLFATTRTFLDYFNLKSLEDLPSLGELKDIESLNRDLVFSDETITGQGEIDTADVVTDAELDSEVEVVVDCENGADEGKIVRASDLEPSIQKSKPVNHKQAIQDAGVNLPDEHMTEPDLVDQQQGIQLDQSEQTEERLADVPPAHSQEPQEDI